MSSKFGKRERGTDRKERDICRVLHDGVSLGRSDVARVFLVSHTPFLRDTITARGTEERNITGGSDNNDDSGNSRSRCANENLIDATTTTTTTTIFFGGRDTRVRWKNDA